MKFYALGGFNEVGKNMTAVEVKGEVVIVDCGVSMGKLVSLEDKGMEYEKLDTKFCIDSGLTPNDRILSGKKVVGVLISHGHLEHIAAIPKLAEKYNCPIFSLPYTLEIIRRLLDDNNKPALKARLKTVAYGHEVEISKNFTAEFVRTTHSIPHPSFIALHTTDGLITFAFDFKLDNHSTLGEKPDYRRFRQLGREGIKLHVNECVHIFDETRCQSEAVAKMMVEDAVDTAYVDSSAVVITTFASHIERIKNIIEVNKGRREIVLLGRSMENYVRPAVDLGLLKLDGAEIYGKSNGIKNIFSEIKKKPERYLVICTGNQGEVNSVLAKLARKEYSFTMRKEDQVIFSAKVIPHPINIADRFVVERDLKEQGVRIVKDVHVSGHAMREDHRDMLKMLTPQHVIPVHGETDRLASYASLATEEGYVIGKTVLILQDGRNVEFA